MSNIIKIFDTTLRDGEQSPGFSMNLEEKLRVALQLEKLGVDIIEAGFPVASPEDFESVKKISEHIKKSEVCALSRAIPKDIESAWEAIKKAKKPRIHTFMSTSEIHLKYQFKKTQKEALEMSINAVKLAKKFCDNIQFSPMDAGRTDKNFLIEFLQAIIDAGATTINIADTVGFQIPEEFGNFIKFLIENTKTKKDVIFSTHCHNDLGLAVANSLAGVKNGATQVECAINGIGERAGNAALEEIVMAIKTRKDFFHVKTNIDTTEIAKSSQLIQQITGQKVQVNKAIVGKNAFAHEAGIHQHGVLAQSKTYEIMTPESIGLTKNTLVLGKHSGRAALDKRLKALGYDISKEKLSEIFLQFKNLADTKKEIKDADLQILMMEKDRNTKLWVLEDFEVFSSSKQEKKPYAKIILKNTKTKQIHVSEKTGTGMVDAAYQAIENICGHFGELTEFSMDSITSGLDAQAIVNLRLADTDGQTISGRAGDTDIVKAAILAYLDVINKQ